MTSMTKAINLVITIAIALGSSTEARAQIVVTFAPPAAYIATSQPEYFGGRPVYWYNNAWYYRDHNRWYYYRHEPVYLHCLLYTSPSPRDRQKSRMPSSA